LFAYRPGLQVEKMVTPLIKHKIVKKRTAKFNKFQSDRFKRLQNVREISLAQRNA